MTTITVLWQHQRLRYDYPPLIYQLYIAKITDADSHADTMLTYFSVVQSQLQNSLYQILLIRNFQKQNALNPLCHNAFVPFLKFIVVTHGF
jgi:hypothetical protein